MCLIYLSYVGCIWKGKLLVEKKVKNEEGQYLLQTRGRFSFINKLTFLY